MLACLKRWSRGVVAGIDGLIVQVENHEAVIASGLSELEASVARARRQLARVALDGQSLRRRRDEQAAAGLALRERARRDPDTAQALESLRSSKRALFRASELGQRLEQHERIARALGRDVQALEQKLAELHDQRDAIEARKARAEAFSIAREELDQTLLRWETRVLESELASGCLPPELEVLDDEPALEKAALLDELYRLKEEV
jgi:phage shock protein A